jgi:hypothetical protein
VYGAMFPRPPDRCRELAEQDQRQGGDILCQPSGVMIWNQVIVWPRGGQAAGAVIAARARLRLAVWTVSS